MFRLRLGVLCGFLCWCYYTVAKGGICSVLVHEVFGSDRILVCALIVGPHQALCV